MADLSDIPDEAVTEAARAFFTDTVDPGEWDDLTPATQERTANRMRAALAAALSVLNTPKATEPIEPNLIMGSRPDGSPWVISAEFAGPTVRVDGYGVLRLDGRATAPREAHRLAMGLLAAIAWQENGGSAKAEAAASLRGEPGE